MGLEEDGDVAVDGGGGDAISIKVGRLDLQAVHLNTLGQENRRTGEQGNGQGFKTYLWYLWWTVVSVLGGCGNGCLRSGRREERHLECSWEGGVGGGDWDNQR